ncbi:hypothetical protein [Gloeocapsopsis sp. IPPAS B-1203]|nr:hypothetical protein [Gloeocapsopsis sp. IPPAS B-1203]
MASNLVITPSSEQAIKILDAIAAIGSNVLDGSLKEKFLFAPS